MTDVVSDVESDWTIDWRSKSFPPAAQGMPASAIAAQSWHAPGDFTTPVVVLKQSALDHNQALMGSYCAEQGVRIAPHGKTTMSPELIRSQLDHGAWGITAATAWQARVIAGFGARRVIVANECVDPVGLRWIAAHVRDNDDAEVLVFVDSVEAVTAMQATLGQVEAAPRIPVLVEVGVDGGRAGARTVDRAVAVGRAVAEAPGLELAGVAGFEGVIGSSRSADTIRQVRAFLTHLREAATVLMAQSAFRADRPVVLSAGGSMFFDQVVDVLGADRDSYDQPVEVVIRSGCYLTHDHGSYNDNSPFAATTTASGTDFRPALELWSRVVSTPEPGLAIIDAGKRDASTDGQLPVVLARLRDGRRDVLEPVTVDRCNDQHGYLQLADPDTLRVGDLVALGIAHPCTTFDKWRAIPVVDDDYRVVSAVRTYF